MNKVLITGLALGFEVDACPVCNYDFEWFVNYPLVFLWADKILVTPKVKDTMLSGTWPDWQPELAQSLKLIGEILQAEGIIEVINPNSIITDGLRDLIFDIIDADVLNLAENYPEHVKFNVKDPVSGLKIDGYEYCKPHIWSIYAGLLLARSFKAQCILTPDVLTYCKYKYGTVGPPRETDIKLTQAFNSVFSAYVPNDSIFEAYATEDKKRCSVCVNEEACKGNYLKKLEVKLKEMLTWRHYDEIHEIKDVMNRIVRKRDQLGLGIEPNEIIEDFREIRKSLIYRVKSTFPKVRRWADITAILSIPIAIAGLWSGDKAITASGASVTAIAYGAGKIIDVLSSKYNWIGFTSSEASCDDYEIL